MKSWIFNKSCSARNQFQTVIAESVTGSKQLNLEKATKSMAKKFHLGGEGQLITLDHQVQIAILRHLAREYPDLLKKKEEAPDDDPDDLDSDHDDDADNTVSIDLPTCRRQGLLRAKLTKTGKKKSKKGNDFWSVVDDFFRVHIQKWGSKLNSTEWSNDFKYINETLAMETKDSSGSGRHTISTLSSLLGTIHCPNADAITTSEIEHLQPGRASGSDDPTNSSVDNPVRNATQGMRASGLGYSNLQFMSQSPAPSMLSSHATSSANPPSLSSVRGSTTSEQGNRNFRLMSPSPEPPVLSINSASLPPPRHDREHSFGFPAHSTRPESILPPTNYTKQSRGQINDDSRWPPVQVSSQSTAFRNSGEHIPLSSASNNSRTDVNYSNNSSMLMMNVLNPIDRAASSSFQPGFIRPQSLEEHGARNGIAGGMENWSERGRTMTTSEIYQGGGGGGNFAWDRREGNHDGFN